MTDILPLKIQNLSLARGGKQVLKDINLGFTGAVKKSVIIGPNGAGKSLLLQACHGLVPVEDGSVLWSGGLPPRALAHAQAMVFQRPVLFRRTALANLELALNIADYAGANRRERASEMLTKTGLARYADTPARALSFGEQQRLALARALAIEPRVLFLDEPTASLDPAAAQLVETLIDEAADAGVKIIMTSHDLNQARRLADEVIFLYRGRVKERGPAEQFFKSPENDLAQAFIRGELLSWRRRSIYNGIDGDEEQ